MDVFDTEWNRLDGATMKKTCPPSGRDFEKPVCLEALLDYARKLSAPFHHARVDFYIVKDRIIFGEITFTNGAGFDRFVPIELDQMMGDWLDLN